jgi:uncharacterized protein (DUF885 family)
MRGQETHAQRKQRATAFRRANQAARFGRYLLASALVFAVSAAPSLGEQRSMDKRFEELANRYLDEFPALSPVGATTLGDHRFDRELDQVSEQARSKSRSFYADFLNRLDRIDRDQLSRPNQVDYQSLRHHLHKRQWQLDELQEWAWNPLVYTQLAGGSIYGLVAREFAPMEQRLASVSRRLEQFPRLYQQIRATLDPQRVPSVHAETAVKQNRGVLSILENMVGPHAAKLSEEEQVRLTKAMETATAAVEEHQTWLENTLLRQAGGDFRIGVELYDKKLALTLATPLTRQEIRDRANNEMRRVRAEMYGIARAALKEKDSSANPPESASPEQQQSVIEAGLELAYAEVPDRDAVISTAKHSLEITTAFVRDHDLVTIPPDPLDIIIMPEFQRGVSVAYCDSPGPLEVGQKTFYAVAPLPEDWTDEQCRSFLREYNLRSIHNLTVHEAMPGHFLQLAHSNRYPAKLRAVLSSGVFIEGWACYAEQMLSEQGFLDGDPLMRLITLKWYLRAVANALLDQAIHVDRMERPAAMKLMMEDTFQEEREAAGKWTRAQLTSVQLATYFVGYLEHRDMRRAAERAWGEDFTLKRYHDAALSHGSPPTRFVRALLLNQPIPE